MHMRSWVLHSTYVLVIISFFPAGWVLTHKAWNKLMHALHGNTSSSHSQRSPHDSESTSACACTGWRISPVENWRHALDASRLYDLSAGGTLSASAYFEVHVRKIVRLSYDTFCAQNPEAHEQCEYAANCLQMTHGHPHLWVSMKDCVRSIMCERSDGRPEFSGMCLGCNSLTKDHGFQQAIAHETQGTMSRHTNNTNMTRAELLNKLEKRAEEAHVSSKREQRQEIVFAEQMAKAESRGEKARSELSSLLGELMDTAEKATAAEREAATLKVELAISAQQHASQEAATDAARGAVTEVTSALKDVQASLHASAITEALMNEQLDKEKHMRQLAEAEAADAHTHKRIAMDARAVAIQRCERALALARAEHEGAVSAHLEVRAHDAALVQQVHEAEMSGVMAAGRDVIAQAEEHHSRQLA